MKFRIKKASTQIKHCVCAAAITIVLIQTAPVLAQADTTSQSSATSQTEQTYPFNIPAKPLPQAIADLSAVTGLQVLYTEQSTFNHTAPALKGDYSVREALRRLLDGSGLTVRFTGSNSVTIELAPSESGAMTLPLMTVTADAVPGELPPAYAGGQIARGGQVGMLGNKDVMDTPFSQTNYTNKTIQDQQAQTIQDILANDPSIVSTTRSSGNERGSNTIRGFRESSENGSGSLNGLAGMSPLRAPDMDYMERVEVLRGPSALLNGMAASGAGGIGGTYNLVTKQADDEPLTQLTTRYSSRSQLGAHLDVGRRFGAENQFGVRFNGAFRKGDTPVRPTSTEVGSAALNLDYRGERVRISADFVHQWSKGSPQNYQTLSIGSVGIIPKAPDAGRSLNPSWTSHEEKTTLAMVRGEVDITDNVTAYAAIGKQKWHYPATGPGFLTLLDASGTFGASGATTYRQKNAYDMLAMQGGLRANATTGPVGHALSLNLSQSRRDFESARAQSAYTYTTNLYNPIFGPAPLVADPGDLKKSNENRVSSVGVADTLSILDERVQFTGGVRYQKVKSSSFNTTTGAKTSGYDSKAWTPAFGLVVKPLQDVSLYASYIENLQAGTIVGTTFANSGEVFSPYVSKQYEAGVKVDWGTVITTLAVFQIAQPSTISIPDPVGGLPTLALDGEQRNRGIELNAYGEIAPGVRLMSGLTLLDPERTKTPGGLLDGKRAIGVPVIRTVIGGEWDTPFLQGLTLTGRATYTGDQVVNNQNLKIPSWAILDLGARYLLKSPLDNKPITIRFNVDNVFGKNYWAAAAQGLLSLSEPRTYRLSATFGF